MTSNTTYLRRRVIVAASALVVVAAAIAVPLLVSGPASTSTRNRSTSSTDKTTRSTSSSAPNPARSKTFLGPYGVEASWVISENKLPGTTAWRITGAPASGDVQGFAGTTYAAVGNTVNFYVTSTAPRYRMEAFRMGWYGGDGARLVWSSPWLTGHVQPACAFTAGVNLVSCANWHRTYALTLTSKFLPGDYLFKLTGSGGQESYVPLTVWDPSSHAAYLIKNDVFTWEAWNDYGGYDFYVGEGNCVPTYPVCNRARIVSFDRPYSEDDGAGDFLANELPLVEFAEEHGLDVAYATDVTVVQHPSYLLQHRVLLSLGHDECWSYAERVAAQRAFAHGVNLVFFGASAILRHVRLQSSPLGPDGEVVDYRDSEEDPLNGKASPNLVTGNAWYSPPTDFYESSLTGEMYAGYINPGEPAAPFVVYDASSFLFKGTGLHDGSQLPGVIAADFDHVSESWPMPSDLQVLGHSPIPVNTTTTDLGQWGNYTYSDMTYWTSPAHKGGVFDSGDNGWVPAMRACVPANSACSPSAAEVGKITGNLLRLFGQGPAGSIDPSVANWRSMTPAGS